MSCCIVQVRLLRACARLQPIVIKSQKPFCGPDSGVAGGVLAARRGSSHTSSPCLYMSPLCPSKFPCRGAIRVVPASILSSHCTRASSTLAGAIATSGTLGRRGAPGCNGACQCAQSAQSGSPRRSRRCVSARHLRAAACRQPRCVAPESLWGRMKNSVPLFCRRLLFMSTLGSNCNSYTDAHIVLCTVYCPGKLLYRLPL